MTSYKTLLAWSALGLLTSAVLVTVCYFFINKQVAYFVHDHELNKYTMLLWMTHTAMVLKASPLPFWCW
jgi:hypothetical protein